MSTHFRTLILLFCILAPASIFAQIETRKVSFPPGSSSTVLTGKIKGDKTIDYVVSAVKGQELKVSLATKSNSLYFNVLPPGSNDEAIFIGSTGGNTYSSPLQKTGDYKIRVYLYRSAARRNESGDYNLTISLQGK